MGVTAQAVLVLGGMGAGGAGAMVLGAIEVLSITGGPNIGDAGMAGA